MPGVGKRCVGGLVEVVAQNHYGGCTSIGEFIHSDTLNTTNRIATSCSQNVVASMPWNPFVDADSRLLSVSVLKTC